MQAYTVAIIESPELKKKSPRFASGSKLLLYSK